MRDVTIDNLKQIGMGVSAEVFLFEEGKVLKLFRESVSREQVDKAYRIARFMSEGQISCPKVYDMVRSGDRYGIISEFIDAPALQISIYNGETKRHDAAVKMGHLLKKVHSMKPADFIPPQKEMVADIYERLGDLLSEKTKCDFMDFLDTFPGKGTVLHGDFHENNMMIRNGELILIDMDSLCIGSPLFEFQQSFTVYRADNIPADWRDKLHYSEEEAQEFIYDYLGSYFDTDNRELLSEYDRIFTKVSALNGFVAKLLQAPPEMRDQMKEFAKVQMPAMERLIKEAPEDFDRLPWKN